MESSVIVSCVHFQSLPSNGEKRGSVLFVFLQEGKIVYKFYISEPVAL